MGSGLLFVVVIGMNILWFMGPGALLIFLLIVGFLAFVLSGDKQGN